MKLRQLLSGVAVAALGFAGVAQAESGLGGGPTVEVLDLGPLITLTSQGAATVNSPDQTITITGQGTNAAGVSPGVVCVLNQASHTGSPSSTFSIQGKDAASGKYYTILTSAATTSDNMPNAIAVGRGVATVANVSAGFPLPPTWRVSVTVGGTSTPVITGTLGCNRPQ